MSFSSRIKHMLGFGNEEFDDDPDVADAAISIFDKKSDAQTTVEGLSEVPTLPAIEPSMKCRIFDGAVAVFNEALPGFIKGSVDTDTQARKLAEALDKGVDDYLNSLMLIAEQYAEGKLKAAADSARREAEKLQTDMARLEQERSSIREQQLSADRRRRALSDRVTDLEAQLATAEAEREQYELENRSLLNKLKVADIQPGVVDDMAREIESLKAQLAAAGNTVAADGADAAATVRAELEAAKTELEAAKADAADARAQQEMTQAMYCDLQSTLANERTQREAAEEQLREARAIVDSVSEIQAQMSKVEEVIRKRDERIERLKTSNKKLRDQLAHAQASDGGLFADEDLDSRSRFAAIEDEFECPDWFVSEPLPGETSPLLQSDADFGYQEPPKKPRRPESDAQLSLF